MEKGGEVEKTTRKVQEFGSRTSRWKDAGTRGPSRYAGLAPHREKWQPGRSPARERAASDGSLSPGALPLRAVDYVGQNKKPLYITNYCNLLKRQLLWSIVRQH